MKKQHETGLVNVGSRLHQQLDAMPVEKLIEMARLAHQKKTSTSSQKTQPPAVPAKAK